MNETGYIPHLDKQEQFLLGYRPVIITVLLIGIGLSGDDDRRIVCGSLAAWQYGKLKRENTQGCCPLNLLVGAQQHVCQTAVTFVTRTLFLANP